MCLPLGHRCPSRPEWNTAIRRREIQGSRNRGAPASRAATAPLNVLLPKTNTVALISHIAGCERAAEEGKLVRVAGRRGRREAGPCAGPIWGGSPHAALGRRPGLTGRSHSTAPQAAEAWVASVLVAVVPAGVEVPGTPTPPPARNPTLPS